MWASAGSPATRSLWNALIWTTSAREDRGLRGLGENGVVAATGVDLDAAALGPESAVETEPIGGRVLGERVVARVREVPADAVDERGRVARLEVLVGLRTARCRHNELNRNDFSPQGTHC